MPRCCLFGGVLQWIIFKNTALFCDLSELKCLGVSLNKQQMTFLNTPNLLSPLGL